MANTRARLREYVRDSPGLHQSRLARDLDLASGQVQYHLHRLVREGAVVAEPVGGKTHYFTPEFDPWERRLTAYLRRETAREIVVRLQTNGSMRPVDLAADLEVARSTITWHVSRLADDDIVEKSDDATTTVSLTDPERTAELLAEVSPTLPESVVDRFIRSVDRMLE